MGLTDEQQQIRSKGIGGSEIGAVVGASRYVSQFDIWLRKTGREAPREDNDYTTAGNDAEPGLIKRIERETGYWLIGTPDGSLTHRHPIHPIVIATPDALMSNGVRQAVAEVKAPHPRNTQEWGEAGTADIDPQYIPQVQWEMGCTGTSLAHVACFGWPTKLYVVPFHQRFFEVLVERAERFWRDHVETGKPPQIEATETAKAWLKHAYPGHVQGEWASADSDTEALVAELRLLKGEADLTKARRADIEVLLKAYIGDKEGLRSTHGSISYREQKGSTKTDWQALAEELRAPQDLIEKHTRIVRNSRRLVTPRDWKQGDSDE